MPIIQGNESIQNPLQLSALNKKGLCDYVINVASGCLHGCTFCYVPSTPSIRVKQQELIDRGVNNPQLDWGKYLFQRDQIPEILSRRLPRMRSWRCSSSGRGVVLLCSGTDPYQNKRIASITRKTVQTLLEYDKEIRILTRSPAWIEDLDILVHPNVSIGMSLPYFDDALSRQIEPCSPPPSERWKALLKGKKNGCRIFIAMAPTPPHMKFDDFSRYFKKLNSLDPEVIFWEPINARGSNGRRMEAAGLSFVRSIMDKKSWAKSFIDQWSDLERAAEFHQCLDKVHIWADPNLKGYLPAKYLDYWIFRPTVENWFTDIHLSTIQSVNRPRFD